MRTKFLCILCFLLMTFTLCTKRKSEIKPRSGSKSRSGSKPQSGIKKASKSVDAGKKAPKYGSVDDIKIKIEKGIITCDKLSCPINETCVITKHVDRSKPSTVVRTDSCRTNSIVVRTITTYEDKPNWPHIDIKVTADQYGMRVDSYEFLPDSSSATVYANFAPLRFLQLIKKILSKILKKFNVYN